MRAFSPTSRAALCCPVGPGLAGGLLSVVGPGVRSSGMYEHVVSTSPCEIATASMNAAATARAFESWLALPILTIRMRLSIWVGLISDCLVSGVLFQAVLANRQDAARLMQRLRRVRPLALRADPPPSVASIAFRMTADLPRCFPRRLIDLRAHRGFRSLTSTTLCPYPCWTGRRFCAWMRAAPVLPESRLPRRRLHNAGAVKMRRSYPFQVAFQLKIKKTPIHRKS